MSVRESSLKGVGEGSVGGPMIGGSTSTNWTNWPMSDCVAETGGLGRRALRDANRLSVGLVLATERGPQFEVMGSL
jgi:hypothetical protein